jgi:prefoldin subunit 5
MNVNVEISIGEFFDKITILEIKKERISNADKLININKELDGLNNLLTELSFSRDEVAQEVSELRKINEALWEIEDDIREKESQKAFDERFVELARAVYITNDKRSDIKRVINLKLGSDFVEEKSYEEY